MVTEFSKMSSRGRGRSVRHQSADLEEPHEKMTREVSCVCSPNPGEAERGGFWGQLAKQPDLLGEL